MSSKDLGMFTWYLQVYTIVRDYMFSKGNIPLFAGYRNHIVLIASRPFTEVVPNSPVTRV